MADDARAQRILEGVRAIPEGFVRTYGDLDPAAPRLVGRVLATSGADVPWHRVVRADGSLTQADRQAALLRREGVPLTPAGRVDLAAARLPLPPGEHLG
ncbi:MGMT family protein [Patulibacter sp.]|uniref:MGMT family protein n=1 Tax=Patulibacter sp. TaxID=1912859 RepID=UPI00351E8197